MKYCRTILVTCCLLNCYFIFGQERLLSTVFVSVFNNATAMPFTGKAGILHSPIHPGFSVGSGIHINKNPRHQFFQNLRGGYFFHRFAQHGLQLYTESGFREKFDFGLGLEFRLGIGYLHSFPHTKIFRLNKDGEYIKKPNFGRPQAMLSAAFGPSFDLEKNGLPLIAFVDYQLWFQYPFVNQYIPLLPNISLHAGVAWRITNE